MTVKETIEREKGNFIEYEIWYYNSENKKIHTDFVNSVSDDIEFNVLKNIEVEDYEIMDEYDYNHTICANCSDVSFQEFYDDENAKVLVIVLKEEPKQFDETKYKNDFAKEKYDTLHVALPKGYKERLIKVGSGRSIAQTIVYLIEKEEL